MTAQRFAADGAGRTIAYAHHTSMTFFGYFELYQLTAGSGGTALVRNMGEKLVSEPLQQGNGRLPGAAADITGSGGSQSFRQRGELIHRSPAAFSLQQLGCGGSQLFQRILTYLKQQTKSHKIFVDYEKNDSSSYSTCSNYKRINPCVFNNF